MNIVGVKDSYSVVAGTCASICHDFCCRSCCYSCSFTCCSSRVFSLVSAVEAVTTDVELATGAADSLDAVVATVDVALVVASVATTSVLWCCYSCMSFYLVSMDSIGQDGS